MLIETRGLSFFGDEWDFLVDRRGMSPSVLLKPHGPHLSLVPILIYKVLLHVFGGGSYLPFRMLAAFDIVILGLALGIACRARWGRWWGLAPVLLLVTLGPGGESLIWAFQSGYAIAVAAGVVALLAVDRGGLRADLLACSALIVSLASASQGVGFVAGAAVMLAIRGDWRRRFWIAAVPAILYALWYLKYGQPASETQLSLWHNSLPYAVQGLSVTMAALLGLSTISSGVLDMTYGVPVALAAIGAIGAACWRGWRPGPLFWGAAVTLIVLWVAASLSNTAMFFRPPNDPRYLSSNAVLVLICICAALPQPRLARVGTIVACVALAIISATNASQYSVARASMQRSGVASRAELGALLIMRGVVSPDFSPALAGDPSVLVGVDARSFFSANDAFGMIADSPATLLHLDEAMRENVDHELERGELSLSPVVEPQLPRVIAPTVLSGAAQTTGGCVRLGSGPVVVRASAKRFALIAGNRTPMTITMRRFAAAYAVMLGSVPPGTAAVASVPSDRAPQIPWQMRVSGVGGQVCALPG